MTQQHFSHEFQGTTIRALIQEGEIWFVARDIAEALGYKSDASVATSKIICRNPEEFAGCHTLTKLVSVTGEKEVTILNEEGLYSFCMLSKTEKAIEFRKFVRTIIKEWRMSVSSGVSLTSPPMQETVPTINMDSIEDVLIVAIQQLKQQRLELQELRSEFELLKKLSTPLLPRQKSEIRNAVSDRMRWLTKNSYAPTFQKLYGALNRLFQVASYTEIPSDRFGEALAFIQNWRPEGTPLQEQIALL